jgi:hypothetical protein
VLIRLRFQRRSIHLSPQLAGGRQRPTPGAHEPSGKEQLLANFADAVFAPGQTSEIKEFFIAVLKRSTPHRLKVKAPRQRARYRKAVV